MFFRNFPKTLYSFDLSGTSPVSVTNIFSRFSFVNSVLNNAFAYYKYQIVDGDTPEIVANKQYGDSKMHWIICLTNNLSDPQFDFPLQQDALERKIIKQYGYPNITNAYSTIHHYVFEVKKTLTEVDGVTTTNTSNSIVTLDQYSYSSNSLVTKSLNTSVSANVVFRANNANAASPIVSTLTTVSTYKPVYVYDYENDLNESKREIKILKAQYIDQVMMELETVLNG